MTSASLRSRWALAPPGDGHRVVRNSPRVTLARTAGRTQAPRHRGQAPAVWEAYPYSSAPQVGVVPREHVLPRGREHVDDLGVLDEEGLVRRVAGDDPAV